MIGLALPFIPQGEGSSGLTGITWGDGTVMTWGNGTHTGWSA